MTDRQDRPRRHAIAEELRSGDRHPITDADRFQRNADVPEKFEAVHLGRDGSITLTYTLDTTVESTEAGGVYEIDLLGLEDNNE